MRHLAERLFLLVLSLTCAGGCAMMPRGQAFGPASRRNHDGPHASAQGELARAEALEAADHESCVDAYFSACSQAWHSVEPSRLKLDTYNAALAGLIRTGQQFSRLDPQRGLVVQMGDHWISVPVVHHAFPWEASDFQRLHAPPRGHEPLLRRRYRCEGLGAPLVVERCRDVGDEIETRFLPPKSFFGATALLRFNAEAAVLELHNPVLVRAVHAEETPLPLTVDLSAPLAKTLVEAPRAYFAGFIAPGDAATAARLNFLEPYQQGKVPVILIHGLFSDPQSWADLVNDLRATPGFCDRYQIWVFRYPTGQGFLQSAAALRTELRAAVDQVDPSRDDPALRQMVLIGHSMGGLIAKLQVTYSDELIWNRLANRPLEEIATTESTRALLAETCYFDPSPHVARVIFVASPHEGSLRSSGLVGRGAALLVEPSPEQAAIHEQLVRDNPDAFNPQFERRFPTSIDMLERDSPLLAAMHQMRLRPGIKLHNILGVSHPVSLDGPSDGVVSVHSASHPGCLSVLAVGAPHAKVHRALETSAEILRILDCR